MNGLKISVLYRETLIINYRTITALNLTEKIDEDVRNKNVHIEY